MQYLKKWNLRPKNRCICKTSVGNGDAYLNKLRFERFFLNHPYDINTPVEKEQK